MISAKTTPRAAINGVDCPLTVSSQVGFATNSAETKHARKNAPGRRCAIRVLGLSDRFTRLPFLPIVPRTGWLRRGSLGDGAARIEALDMPALGAGGRVDHRID